jgi:hypothetical protein
MLGINSAFKNDRLNLSLVVVLSLVLIFWKLGQHPLSEWDESRRGMNALGMMVHRDYINNYYGDYYDTWSAKPPLMVWSIVASYKIWGFNEFALRFPAALYTLLLFSLILCLTIIPVFSLAATKKTWYFAPLLPFISIITTTGIFYYFKRFPILRYLIILLMVFLFSRKLVRIHDVDPGVKHFLQENEMMLKHAEEIICFDHPSQDVFLYLHWYNPNTIMVRVQGEFPPIHEPAVVVFNQKNEMILSQTVSLGPVVCHHELCLGSLSPDEHHPEQ